MKIFKMKNKIKNKIKKLKTSYNKNKNFKLPKTVYSKFLTNLRITKTQRQFLYMYFLVFLLFLFLIDSFKLENLYNKKMMFYSLKSFSNIFDKTVKTWEILKQTLK